MRRRSLIALLLAAACAAPVSTVPVPAGVSVVPRVGTRSLRRSIDSVVNALFTPLAALPAAAAAISMMLVHNAIHVPVPSVSGQAALTMPILVPLSDLLNISRQVTILAYQYGAGLCELLTPTNGALMAVLAASGVRYDQWLKFVLPMWLVLTAIGAAAILIALAIGLT